LRKGILSLRREVSDDYGLGEKRHASSRETVRELKNYMAFLERDPVIFDAGLFLGRKHRQWVNVR
jgi:hypothetical protein